MGGAFGGAKEILESQLTRHCLATLRRQSVAILRAQRSYRDALCFIAMNSLRLPPRRIQIAVASALLFAACAAFFPKDEAPWKETPEAASLRSTSTVSQSTAGPDAAAPRPAGPLLPPRHLRAVFPSLRADVPDWRRFFPERFVVRLAPGLEAPFRMERVELDPVRTVVTARLDRTDTEGRPLHDPVFLVGVANRPGHWDATLVFPGMEYRIEVSPGNAVVHEIPMGEFLCDSLAGFPPGDEPDGGAAPTSAADGSVRTIDVGFFYDTEALAERSQNPAAIDADGAMYVSAGNAILRNSEIDGFVWRYAGSFRVPDHPRNQSIPDDLNLMRSRNPVGDFIRQTQLQDRIDQAVFLAGGVKSGPTGAAWIGGPYHHSAVSYPYPTSSSGVRSSSVLSFYVVCHELGHNFGCRHDRDDPARPAQDGDGYHHYGHKFTDDSTGTDRPYVTMMASGGVRIPYFSNPNVVFRGHPVGVPIGEPRAAYNAKTIADQSSRISVASDPQTAPTLIVQPADVTVSVGQRITLNVEATGGVVNYYWAKNGTGIPGEEGPSLVISNASVADAGTYQALAVNLAGLAYSREAVITVTTTEAGINPPPVTPGTGSSGGGSGGGAAGPLLALACGALFLARALLKRPAQTSSGKV